MLAVGVSWLAPASASAASLWSAPMFLDAGADSGLVDLACPTLTQCVAVDSSGREVMFDPAAPSAWSAYTIDGTRALVAVSCPGASQCVAVDGQGDAITFDPQEVGAGPRRYVIDPGALTAVSCASTSQCIAVDQQGHVVAFSPVGLPDARTAAFSAEPTVGGSHLVACPSESQCSVLNVTGAWTATQAPSETLLTFDPRSLSVVSTIPVPSSVAMQQIVCPSTSECVGAGLQLVMIGGQLGGSGMATVTFAPISSTAGPAVVRGAVRELALACASAALCTVMDASGAETSFAPSGSGVLKQAAVDPLGDYAKGANASEIACPSTGQCVLATWNNSDAITFAPLAPGSPSPVPIDDGAPVPSVACARAGICVGVANTQFAYAPAATSLAALINPGSPPHLDATGLLDGTSRGLACPTRTQCTAVATQGPGCGFCSQRPRSVETTFNPYRPPRRDPYGSPGTEIDNARIGGLSCPTARECTVVDRRGREVTFSPLRPRQRSVHPESNVALTSVSCPAANQCTAIGKEGIEVTFSPTTGSPVTDWQLDGSSTLTAVSCTTVKQCTAVDELGREITFNPQLVAARLTAHQIIKATLTDIACPSQHRCIAVTTTGDSVSGNPVAARRWTVEAVAGASSLRAIACSSPTSCVAGDSAGHIFETPRTR